MKDVADATTQTDLCTPHSPLLQCQVMPITLFPSLTAPSASSFASSTQELEPSEVEMIHEHGSQTTPFRMEKEVCVCIFIYMSCI